jgi:hypothetical protein
MVLSELTLKAHYYWQTYPRCKRGPERNNIKQKELLVD